MKYYLIAMRGGDEKMVLQSTRKELLLSVIVVLEKKRRDISFKIIEGLSFKALYKTEYPRSV